MTTAAILIIALLCSLVRADEIAEPSPSIASDVAPTAIKEAVTATLPALDPRARILFDESDPNILILGSQQTPNFPTIRPTLVLDDGAQRAGSNNDWTPIVWPSTRLPVSIVAPSFAPAAPPSSSSILVRPTQLVADRAPSLGLVATPARIVSALPTRTVPPTGGSRVRLPAPVAATRFDFGDALATTGRPSSEPPSDSAISPSAPVPSELPATEPPVETSSTDRTTATSTESTTSTAATTTVETLVNVTLAPTTSTTTPSTTSTEILQNATLPAPVTAAVTTEGPVTASNKVVTVNETGALVADNETTPIPEEDTLPNKTLSINETGDLTSESEPVPPSPPPALEEISTEMPIDDSSVGIVDSLQNDTIEEELEATVTDQPAVVEDATDLIAELEAVNNNTFSDVETSPLALPDFEVNQTLTSSTTTETSSTSEKTASTSAPIISLDVTSSTAPTNSLAEETTVETNEAEEVTGRSTSSTLSGLLSTLFIPALTRAPSIPTAPPTTTAPTTSTTAATVSTFHHPSSTFWTTQPPAAPPTFHQSAVPFDTPQMTTSNPPPMTTTHHHFDGGHSTFDFAGSSTQPARDDPHHSATTTIIAVSLSVALVICLAILLLVFLVLRRRRARAIQGTCQPARMDAFSLENVSETNTWQRGKVRNSLRSSKRSYLNQAFDDSAVFSVPLTAAQLALYMEKPITSIEAEFRNVATSSVRIDELPPGVETKNRYANVLPVPETRVHIRVGDGNRPDDILEQYINANYIRGPKEEAKYYIACQGPMEHTVEDFWQMVWENQCRLIIQLTDLNENGVARCAEYLPPSEVLDCHRLYGDYQVTLKSRELRDKYVTSSVQLKRMEDNLVRDITHLWYSSWPATGVPDDGKTIVELLLEARKAQSKEQQAPIVVHCSPGTGRTGAALAIDVCMRQLDSSRSIDIPRSVHRLRQDRAGCVQTGEQYAFIYKAVSCYASQLSNAALDSL